MTSFYRKAGKRIFDVAVSATALVVLAPVMLLLSVLVFLKLGSPVFFRQQRPGLHGRPFTLYKFRTMRDAYAADGSPLPDEQRLTRFGRLLRTSSLDELPELFNVLKGEMSLVGPRPLLLKYMPYYTETEQQRHLVKPGITGWAQINGRNNAAWNDRLASDVRYVQSYSLTLDLYIIAKTFSNVVRRQGVVAVPSSTMLDLDVERQRDRKAL